MRALASAGVRVHWEEGSRSSWSPFLQLHPAQVEGSVARVGGEVGTGR